MQACDTCTSAWILDKRLCGHTRRQASLIRIQTCTLFPALDEAQFVRHVNRSGTTHEAQSLKAQEPTPGNHLHTTAQRFTYWRTTTYIHELRQTYTSPGRHTYNSSGRGNDIHTYRESRVGARGLLVLRARARLWRR